ncbi:FAD/NAD(P)-binding protein [Dactylosporangium sp. CA-092794]|uniref:FAD/NAD(P)-binding protein n=1 Tax=Dactylosporangium sp. CA-092794 TaxID=3239929 RepID=UPI003D89F19D
MGRWTMGRTGTTVVVGGGCSGALTAIHLREDPAQEVVIVDPAPFHELGRGAAYRTKDPVHLLNSRAAAMSALADAPDDFLDWCREQGLSVGPTDFVPRRVYGDYVHDRLRRVAFTHVRGVAVRIRPDGTVLLRGGDAVPADRVVLALGHGAPGGPLAITSAVRTHPYYVGNPWSPGALDRVPGDLPVLLIGTGLTALDVALSLHGRGRRAPILAVSRRGLLPQPHLPRQPPGDAGFSYPGTGAAGLLRAVREYAATQPDWRSAVDAIRPQIDRLWWQLSVDARQGFLRHVAAYWEVHRHRMAPEIADRVGRMRRSGELSIDAGKIRSIRRGERGFVVTIDDATRTVGAIVNCTGPGGASTSTLGRALLDDGLARRDATGIGLDVDGLGRLVDRAGEPVEHLFAVGPTRRGAWWETTAVPEIRAQAKALSRHLLERHHVLN